MDHPGSPVEPLLTRKEAAAALKVSLPKINRLLSDGKLKRVRIGGNVRITADDLQRYIRECTEV